jgi:hypothetical protein
MTMDLSGALAAATIATCSVTLLFVFYLLRPEERDRLQEKRLLTLKRLRAAGLLVLTACQSGVLAYRFCVGTIVTSVYDAQLAAPAALWATALVGHGRITYRNACAALHDGLSGLTRVLGAATWHPPWAIPYYCGACRLCC